MKTKHEEPTAMKPIRYLVIASFFLVLCFPKLSQAEDAYVKQFLGKKTGLFRGLSMGVSKKKAAAALGKAGRTEPPYFVKFNPETEDVLYYKFVFKGKDYDGKANNSKAAGRQDSYDLRLKFTKDSKSGATKLWEVKSNIIFGEGKLSHGAKFTKSLKKAFIKKFGKGGPNENGFKSWDWKKEVKGHTIIISVLDEGTHDKKISFGSVAVELYDEDY